MKHTTDIAVHTATEGAESAGASAPTASRFPRLTSTRLLMTTASDVMRHLLNREYDAAVEELLALRSPAAVAYVTAVVVEGMNRSISRAFIAELTEAVNEVRS